MTKKPLTLRRLARARHPSSQVTGKKEPVTMERLCLPQQLTLGRTGTASHTKTRTTEVRDVDCGHHYEQLLTTP